MFVPTIHSPIQVADDIEHKLDQLGFAGPLTSDDLREVEDFKEFTEAGQHMDRLFVQMFNVKKSISLMLPSHIHV